jgi:translation initiation factor 1A
MPKNKGMGGNKRRKGKGNSAVVKELVFKEAGQAYGQITELLGSGYLGVRCFEENGAGVIRRGHIRGKIRKRMWMSKGDIVLVSLRDYQDDTCDIIQKYNSDDARALRAYNEIPPDTDIKDRADAESGADISFTGTADDYSDSEQSDDSTDSLEDKVDDPSTVQAPKKKIIQSKSVPQHKVAPQVRNYDLPEIKDDDDIDIDAI